MKIHKGDSTDIKWGGQIPCIFVKDNKIRYTLEGKPLKSHIPDSCCYAGKTFFPKW